MINSHFNSNNPSYQKGKEGPGLICNLSFSWLEYSKTKRKKEIDVVLPSPFEWRETEENTGSPTLCKGGVAKPPQK